MSVVSRLLVVQSDPRLAEAVRYGFEREGSRVVTLSDPQLVAPALRDTGADAAEGAAVQLVVAGARSRDEARGLLDALRDAMADAGSQAPILYLGNGVSRAEALAAGAAEVLPQPAFVRDMVTLGKLLASPKPGAGAHASTGELADYLGVFYIIRALAAVERTGVLTLVRGLRRGELRFYQGEVTSAQVGVLHGQSALHQLLLWTEARFEFRTEPVVRRRQIPLSPSETLDDAARFLRQIRDAAGALAPGAVYQQVPARLAGAGDIPRPVGGIIRLFDGHRSVADVVEDSPFRIFETLRIANRLAALGVLEQVSGPGPQASARAVLAVEEWLTGTGVVAAPMELGQSEPIGPRPGEPASPPKKRKGGKKRRRKRKRSEPGAAQLSRTEAVASPSTPLAQVDWSELLPDENGPDIGLSPVVPATEAVGEIVVGDDPAVVAERAALREARAVARQALRHGSEPGEAAAGVPAEADAAAAEQDAPGGEHERGVPDAQDDGEGETAPMRARDAERAALRPARGLVYGTSEIGVGDSVSGEIGDSGPVAAAREAAEPEIEAGEPEAEPAEAAAAASEPAEAEIEPVEAAAASEPAAASDVAPAASDVAEPDIEPAAAEPEVEPAEVAAAAGEAAEATAEPEVEAAEATAEPEVEPAEAAEAAEPESEPAEPENAPAVGAEAGSESTDLAVAAAVETGAAEEPESELAEASQASGSIEAGDQPSRDDTVDDDAPSILVGEIHRASEGAAVRAAKASLGDAAPSSRAAGGADLASNEAGARAAAVAADAAHFTDDEEAFFAAGQELQNAPPPPVESFDDLDTGYQRKSFWQRLFSRRRR